MGSSDSRRIGGLLSCRALRSRSWYYSPVSSVLSCNSVTRPGHRPRARVALQVQPGTTIAARVDAPGHPEREAGGRGPGAATLHFVDCALTRYAGAAPAGLGRIGALKPRAATRGTRHDARGQGPFGRRTRRDEPDYASR